MCGKRKDAGCQMPAERCKMLDARCWMLVVLIMFCIMSGSVWAHAQVNPAKPSETGNQMANFTVEPGEDLVVQTSGDILVTVSDQNQVVVNSSDFDEDSRMTATRVGSIVRVSSRGEYADIHVTVPSKFNVDLQTSSGEIRIRGVLTGKITADTSGGDITLDNVAGEVDLRTSGGVINTRDITGNASLHSSGGEIYSGKVTGDLDVETGGGDLALKDVSKNLSARTGGGNIDVGDVGGTALLSTGGGDITIGNVHGTLSAVTGGGNITAAKIDNKVTMKTGGGDIDLQSANGAVVAKTSGGSITADVNGSLDASTSGGDVSVKLRPSGIGPSEVFSAGGDITLYIPETAKVKIDATIRIRGRWALHTEECEISSDFKATSFEKNEDEEIIHGVYTLNGGGETVSLETVNSNIAIRSLK